MFAWDGEVGIVLLCRIFSTFNGEGESFRGRTSCLSCCSCTVFEQSPDSLSLASDPFLDEFSPGEAGLHLIDGILFTLVRVRARHGRMQKGETALLNFHGAQTSW